MFNPTWKIESLNLKPVGTGDSVEVTKFTLVVEDSAGNGVQFGQSVHDWVPKQSVYYPDSATARAVSQSDAFDNWLELDSEHTHWMQRVQWSLKTNLYLREADLSEDDSYRISKLVILNDSAEVVNPLGL
jgi:hypothetical protein